jgi:hypothetical protein
MQLVAYGAQDVYLTGNPQITFFKVVYRRHTNFSFESIETTFNGNASFGKRVTCTITRNGDLITRCYLKVQLPEISVNDLDLDKPLPEFAWTSRIGHALVRSMELEIGGTRVDKVYSEWLTVWQELTVTKDTQEAYESLIGNTEDLVQLRTPTQVQNRWVYAPAKTLYVPCPFWFSRNNGLALPLIALQYHEVKMTFEFRQFNELICHSADFKYEPCDIDATLLVDYVYLDTEERKRFAQISHEYLIEQLQFTGEEALSKTAKYRLNFNHPCKYLTWNVALEKFRSGRHFAHYTHDWDAVTVQEQDALVQKIVGARITKKRGGAVTYDDLLSYPLEHDIWQFPEQCADEDDFSPEELFPYVVHQYDNFALKLNRKGNPVKTSSILLNGHERTGKMQGTQTNKLQAYQHWNTSPADGVNSYSFALNPVDHQPSGTCNFSRIDTAQLNIQCDWSETIQDAPQENGSLYIFAVNYNVLRIMSGMAGVAYCN